MKRHTILLLVIVLLSVGSEQLHAQCLCRGDVDENGLVTVADLLWIVQPLSAAGPPFVIPGTAVNCADVADANGMGLADGDGQIDIGDLIFLAGWVFLEGGMFYQAPCAAIDYAAFPSDAEIMIGVNDVPWDGFSQVAAGDIITVTWYENVTAWCLGFCNFNLNVSRGIYRNDFATSIGWDLINFTAESDGRGGIDVGGGCYSVSQFVGAVFSFSFQVPLEIGPAYTIHIHPTQGSWRRIMFDELPTVDLAVMEKTTPACVDPLLYDLDGDCKVTIADLAVLSAGWQDTYVLQNLLDMTSQWLDCGLDIQSACWE